MPFNELLRVRDAAMSYAQAKIPFWTGVRLGLKLAQMFIAVFSSTLLLESGLNLRTFVFAAYSHIDGNQLAVFSSQGSE